MQKNHCEIYALPPNLVIYFLVETVVILYTNSLVNADSFYANFTNTHFQKVPIPHFNTYYETKNPQLKRISLNMLY